MPDPAEVVAAQLAAYNDRDIDRFMTHWHPDATIHAWPDTVLAEGSEAIRQRHLARFAEPHLHAVLLSRIVIDSLIVDRETVTRTDRDRAVTVEVIALYEVRDGQIRRAWFKQSQ